MTAPHLLYSTSNDSLVFDFHTITCFPRLTPDAMCFSTCLIHNFDTVPIDCILACFNALDFASSFIDWLHWVCVSGWLSRKGFLLDDSSSCRKDERRSDVLPSRKSWRWCYNCDRFMDDVLAHMTPKSRHIGTANPKRRKPLRSPKMYKVFYTIFSL